MEEKKKCCGIDMIEADSEMKKSIIGGGCSCFQNAPCGFCATEVFYCSECAEYEEETF